MFFLLGTYLGCAQDTLTIEGSYRGKDIFITNNGTPGHFCTQKVLVNGAETKDTTTGQAYHINLAIYNFGLGTPVKIQIVHTKGCLPHVVMDHSTRNPTFEIKKIELDTSGLFTWSTGKEEAKLTYVIEQFEWNKWIKIGEVEGKGSYSDNAYQFKIVPHSGLNKIRVKQNVSSGSPRVSQVVERDCHRKEVKLITKTMTDYIEFSAETRYELHDQYGNIIKKGIEKKVDCTDLKKGMYYISFDNKTESISKMLQKNKK